MGENTTSRHVLVAAAWPYANGPLHLGHISSLIGADVLARYHRLKGDSVLFVSGSDCYGTPIAVEATARGVSPESIATRYHAEFEKTLIDGFHFSYDNFSQTMSPKHARVAQDIFSDLHRSGYIYIKTEQSLYSPSLDRFLPDRFVEGECPRCGFADARGDQCDECGSLLEPLSLVSPRVNPKILPEGADGALEVRDSDQFYLSLSSFQDVLERWVAEASGSWRLNAAQFTKGFLRQGLHDRAISRDTDWGIPVPLPGYENKKLYVWFEAVLGYLSASRHLPDSSGSDPDAWKRWWLSDDALHYYVHGKDNVPFHTILFPAVLTATGLHLPDRVFSSEYLLLEGRQLSTSRSFAVWADEFLERFDGELARYFLLAHGPETSDIDFRWSDFGRRVNGELIGTLGNLVNRICSFTESRFPEGVSPASAPDTASEELLARAEEAFREVGDHIEQGEFRRAFRVILRVAEQGNRFAHLREPWKRIAEDRDRAGADLATLLHAIHAIASLADPFLPRASRLAKSFFADAPDSIGWQYPAPASRYVIRGTAPLFKKIDDSEIQAQREKLGIS